ncbi:MAG: cupin domain-containing protein [Alphaproteobacteria bacterium]|nr:cupin domain-containing protein [Alphaproteobacteria bacterium]
MARHIRRIVTGHDSEGRSTVLYEGPAPNPVKRKAGWTATVLWHTDSMPARYADDDRALGEFGVEPPKHGTIFRTVEFPPDSETGEADNAEVLAELGLDPAQNAARPDVHHTLHRTDTVDYLIVLTGEIDMQLDTGEVHLEAGDVVVQQGTVHAFRNRSDSPCLVAAVLVDASGG